MYTDCQYRYTVATVIISIRTSFSAVYNVDVMACNSKVKRQNYATVYDTSVY